MYFIFRPSVPSSGAISRVLRSSNRYFSSKNLNKLTLSGFSRFVSRKDVQLVLDDIPVSSIHPEVDDRLFPTGRYILNSSLSAPVMNTRIQSKFGNRYSVSATSIKYNPLLTSDFDITNCTVRCRYVRRGTSMEHLRLAFENYKLRVHPIVKLVDLPHSDRPEYLIHFANPAEAERAALEKDGMFLDGADLKLIWYQC